MANVNDVARIVEELGLLNNTYLKLANINKMTKDEINKLYNLLTEYKKLVSQIRNQPFYLFQRNPKRLEVLQKANEIRRRISDFINAVR